MRKFAVVRIAVSGALVIVVAFFAVRYMPRAAHAFTLESAPPAPAFTHDEKHNWINSEPLNWQALRGQVVLLDFWTFMCWNCYRSFPWLTSMEAELADQDFTVIGVHTPEFESEKDRARIKERAEHFGLHHPIMVDNDMSYWNAMSNRYWPAYFLIDKKGRVRYFFAGETHAGEPQAKAIEARIRELLAETG